MRQILGALAAVFLAAGDAGAAGALTPDQAAFMATYKELVETNTQASNGDCTLAAQRMAARLKAAGFADSQLTIFATPEYPTKGGLVAVLPGRDPKVRALLLLAHIDVVEAHREDWTRDPFKLVEEDGWFYARGASDMKAQAAIWVDTLIRFRQAGYQPRRTIKLALTCGEEGGHPFNGAHWLVDNRRDLIDAEFALNEGAGGVLDDGGRRLVHALEAAEKNPQTFTLEATNPGGHASRPVPDNAIYHVVDAVKAIQDYEFPVQISPLTAQYLTRLADVVGGERGAAMRAIVANPADARADALLSRDQGLHAILRTTCVATMMTAGHAPNALPQRARATINCRIFPGEPREAVRATLIRLIHDPAVSVSEITTTAAQDAAAAAPPMPAKVLGPIQSVSAQIWPGVPVVQSLQAWATDARWLNAAGIPTYGVSGLFFEPDLGHIHGLNERIGVTAVWEGREFLYRLVKAYGETP